MKSKVEKLRKQMEKSKKAVIVSHSNPDGDAVGSSLAVWHWLRKKGLEATAIMPNDYPDFLKWLPGNESVVLYECDKDKADLLIAESDLIFCLDFNDLSRIREMGHAVAESKAFKVMVDHHVNPDDFPDFIYHDPKASSTAELVYDLIRAMGDLDLIDQNTASCIYTGILTDTGAFQFSSTSPKVLRIAADLLETGISGYEIYDRIFNSYDENRLKFFGFCWTKRMEIIADGKAGIIGVSAADQFRFHLKKGDTEGLVNTPLQIKGVVLSAFAKVQDKVVKLSFRSKGNIDVNQLARTYFNGGGHVNAAGGMMEEPLEKVLKKLKEIIPEYLKQYEI